VYVLMKKGTRPDRPKYYVRVQEESDLAFSTYPRLGSLWKKIARFKKQMHFVQYPSLIPPLSREQSILTVFLTGY
jgi:hypothetical protein